MSKRKRVMRRSMIERYEEMCRGERSERIDYYGAIERQIEGNMREVRSLINKEIVRGVELGVEVERAVKVVIGGLREGVEGGWSKLGIYLSLRECWEWSTADEYGLNGYWLERVGMTCLGRRVYRLREALYMEQEEMLDARICGGSSFKNLERGIRVAGYYQGMNAFGLLCSVMGERVSEVLYGLIMMSFGSFGSEMGKLSLRSELLGRQQKWLLGSSRGERRRYEGELLKRCGLLVGVDDSRAERSVVNAIAESLVWSEEIASHLGVGLLEYVQVVMGELEVEELCSEEYVQECSNRREEAGSRW